jgi:hypothetical protein
MPPFDESVVGKSLNANSDSHQNVLFRFLGYIKSVLMKDYIMKPRATPKLLAILMLNEQVHHQIEDLL